MKNEANTESGIQTADQNENQGANQSGGEIWTVGKILAWMTQRFSKIERSTPRLDAQLLLSHVIGLSRVELYTGLDRPLSEKEREDLRGLVRRRMLGEPVAYILGRKNWHDFSLAVDRRVLIPRPETETLFDLSSAWLSWDLEKLRLQIENKELRLTIVDLCTGSGCLALAFAKAFQTADVLAVDCSAEALEVARQNGQELGLPQIEWLHADACSDEIWQEIERRTNDGGAESVPSGASGHVVFVVSNPPYVSEHEWNQCDIEVKNFEPRLALVAEENGLALSRSIFKKWNAWASEIQVQSKGHAKIYLALELGEGHPAQLLCEQLGEQEGREKIAHCVVSAHAHSREYPRSQGFVCEDLEGKGRFLFAHFGKLPVPDSEPESE